MLITVLVALVAHGILRRLIDRFARHSLENGAKPKLKRLRRAAAKEDTEASAAVLAQRDVKENRRRSRIKTLASVAKSALAIFIWTCAGLAVLSALGVNIAPLIASAGVVGVALGFGAQALVKDFLSGIFMLLEDQYGVGDTIDVGEDIVGTVEDISLRLTTVRDIDGTLWYVRNGEILRVGNFSDEYAIARIETPVGLSNDMDRAWQVIQSAITEGVTDPAVRGSVIGEPEMNGMSAFEPDHATFRVTIRTLPGEQWGVQRELQRRVLGAMQDNGISTPYPHGIGVTKPSQD